MSMHEVLSCSSDQKEWRNASYLLRALSVLPSWCILPISRYLEIDHWFIFNIFLLLIVDGLNALGYHQGLAVVDIEKDVILSPGKGSYRIAFMYDVHISLHLF